MEHRRWYDQDRACTRLLEQVRTMSHPLVREFSARVLINFAEKLRKVIDVERPHLRVSGMEAEVTNYMHRFGQQKQRWYDQDPVVYEAVSELYHLPAQGLAALGYHLGETFNLIQIYAGVCIQLNEEPTYENLARICLISLQVSPHDAEQTLIKLVGKARFELVRQQLARGQVPGSPG